MRKLDMTWEQQDVTIVVNNICTPVELLEKLGKKGREMLIEVLYRNYYQEVESYFIRDNENNISASNQ